MCPIHRLKGTRRNNGPKQTSPDGTPVILLGTVLEELFAGVLLQPLCTLSHHGLLHLRNVILWLQKKHQVQVKMVTQLWTSRENLDELGLKTAQEEDMQASACSDSYVQRNRDTEETEAEQKTWTVGLNINISSCKLLCICAVWLELWGFLHHITSCWAAKSQIKSKRSSMQHQETKGQVPLHKNDVVSTEKCVAPHFQLMSRTWTVLLCHRHRHVTG